MRLDPWTKVVCLTNVARAVRSVRAVNLGHCRSGSIAVVLAVSGWSMLVACSQGLGDDQLRQARFEGVTLQPFRVECGDPRDASSLVLLHRAEAGGHSWYTSGFPSGGAFLPDRTYVGTLSVGTPIAETGTKQGVFSADSRSEVVYRDQEPFDCIGGAPSWPY